MTVIVSSGSVQPGMAGSKQGASNVDGGCCWLLTSWERKRGAQTSAAHPVVGSMRFHGDSAGTGGPSISG